MAWSRDQNLRVPSDEQVTKVEGGRRGLLIPDNLGYVCHMDRQQTNNNQSV